MTVHVCLQTAHQKFCNFKIYSDYQRAFLTYAKCELHKTFQNKTFISRVCLGVINGDHSAYTVLHTAFLFFNHCMLKVFCILGFTDCIILSC